MADKKKNAPLPASSAGLLRFFEDETKLSNKDGQVLPDAKLLPENATAKNLAETIHQDIAKGFLFAIDAKTKQRIGADHQLKNGDVIKIVSSLSRG